jgi:hypothetical protein
MDNYDSLKPVMPQDGAEVDWVCLTDSVPLAMAAQERPVPDGTGGERLALMHPTGWEIIPYQRLKGEHPNRAAKAPKTHPRLFTHAPASVWLDASFRVVSPRLVVDTLTIAHERGPGIAQFVHPWRRCAIEEGMYSAELPKYADERTKLLRQIMTYTEQGMPQDWGLWATGVIARHHTHEVTVWGQRWARQIADHSYQDQVGHAFTCWKMGLRPAPLPGNHLGNQWLAYEGSGRH